MDQRRTRPGALNAAALALALAGVATAAESPTLRAERWLSPSADRVGVLTREPAECLSPTRAGDAARSVEIGRAAFRSPLLLGGQAARSGMSCESCHRNGRGHPGFLFPGLSGDAGTADVTSSLFSSHRGNGTDDPRPIPDLSGDRAGLTMGSTADAEALRPFIRGLIVEEFDGVEPPPAVLDGLAAYVDALAPEACPQPSSVPVTLGGRLKDARRAVSAASAEAAADPATAIVLLHAAREALSLINERYPGEDLAAERALVRAADLDLAAALAAIRTGDADVPVRLAAWLTSSRDWERKLAAAEFRSLFNPERIATMTAD